MTIKIFQSILFLIEINVTLLQRFGSALVPWGSLQIKQKQYAKDFQPIDPDCECPTCRRWEFLELSSAASLFHSLKLHSAAFCVLFLVRKFISDIESDFLRHCRTVFWFFLGFYFFSFPC